MYTTQNFYGKKEKEGIRGGTILLDASEDNILNPFFCQSDIGHTRKVAIYFSSFFILSAYSNQVILILAYK